jgi:hypothetical protein
VQFFSHLNFVNHFGELTSIDVDSLVFRSIYWATPLAGYDSVYGSGRVEGKQVNSLGGFSEWCPVMGAGKQCESIRGPPSLRCPEHALVCSFCSQYSSKVVTEAHSLNSYLHPLSLYARARVCVGNKGLNLENYNSFNQLIFVE